MVMKDVHLGAGEGCQWLIVLRFDSTCVLTRYEVNFCSIQPPPPPHPRPSTNIGCSHMNFNKIRTFLINTNRGTDELKPNFKY
jgi:hypothetical protein